MSIEWKEDGGVILTGEEAQQFLNQIEHPDIVKIQKANSLLELGRSIFKTEQENELLETYRELSKNNRHNSLQI